MTTDYSEPREAAYWETVPDAVKQYLEIDLSTSGEVVKELFDGLEYEVSNEAALIELFDEKSDRPSSLTSHMDSWYRIHISPVRSAALAATRSRFSEDKIKNVPTILFESKRDDCLLEAAKRSHQAVTDFHRDNNEDIKARNVAENDYEAAKALHGQREPVITNRFLYVGILCFLAALEFFMNLTTMLYSPMSKGIPALAFALTTGAAIFIGLASHVDGTLVKQWNYYMHSEEADRKRQCLSKLIGSAFLLTFGLGVIGFGRYFYAKAIIEKAILLGNDPSGMASLMIGTMIGNVGVWLVGAFVAYLMHDADPDYPALKVKYDELKNRVAKKYHASVTEKLKSLDEKCRTDIKIFEQQNASQHVSNAYASNRKLFDKIVANDRRVSGILQKYREEFRKKHPKVRVNQPDKNLVDPSRRKTVTVQEWATSELTLKYNGGADA